MTDDLAREAVAAELNTALWKVEENHLSLKQINTLRDGTTDRILAKLQYSELLAERDALKAQIKAMTSDAAVEAACEALKTYLLANSDEDIETTPALAIRCILAAAVAAAKGGDGGK